VRGVGCRPACHFVHLTSLLGCVGGSGRKGQLCVVLIRPRGPKDMRFFLGAREHHATWLPRT